MTPSTPSQELARGIRSGIAAFTLWGLLAIYWKQLSSFNAVELIGWRSLAAAVVMTAVVTIRGHWASIHAAFATLSSTARITVAACLLAGNWTAYVYAVGHDRVVEAALGYFIAPLLTMLLGITVLGERPTRGQKIALVLAAAAVVELTVAYGRVPVAALVMAVSWSLYGLLKRRDPIPAVESFAAESFVLAVPAAIVVLAFAGGETSVPRSGSGGELALMCFAGFATSVPLILFADSASRVPLTVLGPLQYLVPTITFIIGWALYDEELPWSRLVGFGLVWIALIVVTVDRLQASFRRAPAGPVAATVSPD